MAPQRPGLCCTQMECNKGQSVDLKKKGIVLPILREPLCEWGPGNHLVQEWQTGFLFSANSHLLDMAAWGNVLRKILGPYQSSASKSAVTDY